MVCPGVLAASACEAPAHRAFDFWLGEWQVRTPDADGSVRQLWESTDTKGPWSTVFDGQYTRK